MDRRAEMLELDNSLSAMTDLLLSDSGDDLDLQGDFTQVPGSGARKPERRPSGGPEPEGDAASQIDEVQAAVAAALEDAAAELETGQPASQDAAGEAGESPSEDVPDGSDPEPLAGEVVSLMEAVSAELDAVEPSAVEQATRDEPAPAGAAASEEAQASAEPRPATDESAEAAEPGWSEEEPGASGDVPDEAVAAQDRRAVLGKPPAVDRAPLAAPSEVAAATPAVHATPVTSGKSGVWVRIWGVVRPLLVRMNEALAGLAARAAEPVAKRLAGQSRTVRQSLAWLAVWTAFNAGAVWGFLLLFRSTNAGPDAPAAIRINGAEAAGAGSTTADPAGPGE